MARRAIDLALDLARMPALAGTMREQPLPSDILDLIRVAAGCPEASKAVLVQTQQSLRVIQAAAVLYLEEMLFFPDAGLHRNLGVAADATKADMRLHMRWLLQWLHPDHNADETAGLLAQRVIHAWRELGRRDLPESSVVISSALQRRTSGQASLNNRRYRTKMRARWIPVPVQPAPSAPRRGLRAIVIVLAVAGALALIFVPNAFLFGWHSLSVKDQPASLLTQGGAGLVDVTGE